MNNATETHKGKEVWVLDGEGISQETSTLLCPGFWTAVLRTQQSISLDDEGTCKQPD